MAFSANTHGFPGGLQGYGHARSHFDSKTPWRSWRFNPGGDERPIGRRAVKTNDGRRYNKAMRELSDGSIAFRLFDTDCVIWHPDGQLTVQGYASKSTTDFISMLTPHGISHSYRTIMYNGRRSYSEDPVLHLSGLGVVRCDQPVRLDYNAGVWTPADEASLDAFYVPRVDRRAARQVSKQYNLPELQQIVNAIMALNAPPPPPADREGSMSDIMAALEAKEYMAAIALMPRGTSESFGRTHGTPRGIKPGFLTKLRNHIYDHEGVVERVEERVLGSSSYKRYIADMNRFDYA